MWLPLGRVGGTQGGQSLCRRVGSMWSQVIEGVEAVYVESVLGVVSGGRGTLGRCGGINNPVHYVR